MTHASAPPAIASAHSAPVPDLGGAPAVARFRDRVRARLGSADLLAFTLGAERFAFDVRALDEAREEPPLARALDGSTPALASIDGETIPVFDAARMLGVPGARGGHLLIMRSGVRRIALSVDDVDDVVAVNLADIRPAPFDGEDDLLLGVLWDGATLTAILDARTLIGACLQRVTVGTRP